MAPCPTMGKAQSAKTARLGGASSCLRRGQEGARPVLLPPPDARVLQWFRHLLGPERRLKSEKDMRGADNLHMRCIPFPVFGEFLFFSSRGFSSLEFLLPSDFFTSSNSTLSPSDLRNRPLVATSRTPASITASITASTSIAQATLGFPAQVTHLQTVLCLTRPPTPESRHNGCVATASPAAAPRRADAADDVHGLCPGPVITLSAAPQRSGDRGAGATRHPKQPRLQGPNRHGFPQHGRPVYDGRGRRLPQPFICE